MEDDERDGDTTKPDLPSGLGSDEPTNPGVGGLREAWGVLSARSRRAADAFDALVASCPERGEPGRRRHLEVMSHAAGGFGDLWHDTRRVTNQLIREEESEK